MPAVSSFTAFAAHLFAFPAAVHLIKRNALIICKLIGAFTAYVLNARYLLADFITDKAVNYLLSAFCNIPYLLRIVGIVALKGFYNFVTYDHKAHRKSLAQIVSVFILIPWHDFISSLTFTTQVCYTYVVKTFIFSLSFIFPHRLPTVRFFYYREETAEMPLNCPVFPPPPTLIPPFLL